MWAGSRVRAVGAAVAAVVVVSACTTQVEGSAVKATGAGSEVDVAALNVGNYPTKPSPPMGTAGTPQVGAIVEAQRMANNVTGPWEVDPALAETYAVSGMVVLPGRATVPALRDFTEVLARHRLVNGFFTSRQSADETKILQNAVLRFPDPGAAAAAVADLGRYVVEHPVSIQTSPTAPVPVPGHPEAVAFSTTFNSGAKTWTTVRSASPRGPYVFVQNAQSTVGLEPAAALVAGTLDRQGPLIDQFSATDPAAFADLPLDPSGLLAKTLPIATKDASLIQRTVYQPRGALHFQGNAVTSSATFDEAGVDEMSYARAILYRARDAAGAERVATAFADELMASGKAVTAVPGLSDSRCVLVGNVRNFCYATADRYAIEVDSNQLPDAHQRLAAQYAMLVAS